MTYFSRNQYSIFTFYGRVKYIPFLISDTDKRTGIENCQVRVINQGRLAAIGEALTAYAVSAAPPPSLIR